MTIEMTRITKGQATHLLNSLETAGVNVTMARRDLETRSRYYNVLYCDAMTAPIVTYTSE